MTTAAEDRSTAPIAKEGTVEEVVRGEAAWCVVHGDALHVLGDLPDACVDAFVTDPPYSSGGAFRGDRVKATTAKYVSTNSANKEIPAFEGDVRDQRSFTLWTALWSSEAWRAGVDGCHLVAFSDWRQLPALCDAVQAGGWLWRGIAAWDKTEASRPRNGGFRAQCEFMTWATRGPFARRRRVAMAVLRTRVLADGRAGLAQARALAVLADGMQRKDRESLSRELERGREHVDAHGAPPPSGAGEGRLGSSPGGSGPSREDEARVRTRRTPVLLGLDEPARRGIPARRRGTSMPRTRRVCAAARSNARARARRRGGCSRANAATARFAARSHSRGSWRLTDGLRKDAPRRDASAVVEANKSRTAALTDSSFT